MKKIYLLFLMLLIPWVHFGQINYSYDWEPTGLGNWVSTGSAEMIRTTSNPCVGIGSVRTNFYEDYWYYDYYGDNTFRSPLLGVSNQGLTNVSLNYKVVNYSGGSTLATYFRIKMQWSNSVSGPWTDFYEINQSNHTPSTSCALVTASFIPLSGDTYIRFIANDLSNGVGDYYIYYDNVAVNQGTTLTCFYPSGVNVINVTSTGATINWLAPTSLPSEGYQYEIRTDTNPGVAGAGLITSGNTASGILTASISSLNSMTNYKVYIRSICSSSDVSPWTSVKDFTTLCSVVSALPYLENFDTYGTGSSAFPTCWLRPIIYSGYPSIVSAYSSSSPNSLRFNSEITNPTYAISPPFSQDIQTLRVKFKLKREGTSSGVMELGVMSDPTDLTTFELVRIINPNHNDFNEYVIDLNNVTMTGGNKSIALRQKSNSASWYYFLDDFVVQLIPSCLEISNLQIPSITNNAAVISWNASTSLPANGYEYEIRTSGAAGSGATGLINTGSVAAGVLTANINSLTASTTYSVYVRAACSITDKSEWSVVQTFKTTCDIVNIPYNVVMPTTGIPDCFRTQNVNEDATVWTSAAAQTGITGRVMSLSASSTLASDDWFYLQGLQMTAGQPYRLSFKYKKGTATANQKLKIAYGLSSTNNAMTNQIVDVVFPANATAQSFYVDFIPAVSGAYYIGFHGYAQASQGALYVGEIKVENAPSCLLPLNITLNSITNNSVNVSWTSPLILPLNGYGYEIRTSGAAGSGATGLVSSGSVAAGVLAANINSLIGNTTYSVYVRSICSLSSNSEWTVAQVFKTECDVTNIPYTVVMPTTGIPDCFKTQNVNEDTILWTSAAAQTGITGRVMSLSASSTLASDDWFYLQGLQMTAGQPYRLSFKYKKGTATANQKLKIAYGLSTLNSTMTNQIVDVVFPSNADAQSLYVDFISAVSGTYYIGFHGYAAASQGNLYVGEIKVENAPSCMEPLNVSLSGVTKNSVQLNWLAPLIAPTNGYVYEVRTSGNAGSGSEGLFQSGTASALEIQKIITGLLPSSTYTIFIRSVCGTDNNSIWKSAGTITTMCDYPDFISATPATICGMGTATLSATYSSGNVKWFATATGGNPIHTGNSFTTPEINSTTSYWVEGSGLGSINGFGGKENPSSGSTGTSIANWGIIFNVTESLKLLSTSVYSSSAGTVNVKILNPAGTEIYETGNITVINGGTTTPNIIPLNINLPAGNGYKILIKSYSGATIIRESSGLSFPYNDVNGKLNVISSEWGGATTGSYYYFYNLQYEIGCTSPRTEVIATVTTAPILTLSETELTICEGSSANITIATGASNYDTFVWLPSEGVSGSAADGWVFNPTTTTSYTLTASQSGGSECVVTKTVLAEVVLLPVYTPLDIEYVVCSDEILELDLNISSNGQYISGTSNSVADIYGGPNPFSAHYGGNKAQMIYSAAELSAQGMVAGSIISSVAFDISVGSSNLCNDFTIRIGSTTQNDFTDAFLPYSSLSVVYNQSFIPSQVGLNTFSFTMPYVWDGISNIVLQTVHNQGNTGNGAGSIIKYTATANNSSLYGLKDNVTPAGAASFDQLTTFSSGEVSKNRPNTIFTFSNEVNVVWSPVDNLYTDENATTPYVANSSATKVYFKSNQETNQLYNINIIGNNNCSTQLATTINVPILTAPVASAQQFCNVVSVSDIVVSGIQTNGLIKWYATETSNDVINTIDTSGTYYVVQDIGGCSSSRVAVEINVNNIDEAPIANTTQIICGSGTVADLQATALTGNTIHWFNNEDATISLNLSDVLESGTYYVAQFNEYCWSPKLAVAVEVNPIPTAPVSVNQSFCGVHTLAAVNLSQDANATLNWYSNASSTTILPLTTEIVSGIYYVSQTINGCESDRVSVEMEVKVTLPAPVAPATQFFCGLTTVSNLEATILPEGTIGWFLTQDSETPLGVNQNIITGSYFVSQFNGACWSPKTIVAVTVNAIPAALNNTAQQLCGVYNLGQVSVGAINNATVNWYASQTSSTSLPLSSQVVTGEYYISQTVDGCESPRLPINLTITPNLTLPTAQIQTFCNSGTVGDLVAQGTIGASFVWYTSATSATPLPINTSLVTGTYYVAQTFNGCYSERRAVAVRVVSTTAPIVSPFVICGSGTISDLYIPAASGVTFKWYSSPTSTSQLAQNTVLTSGTYYVSRLHYGCESLRASVSVTIASIPNAPTGSSVQSFEEGSTISDLVLNQQNVTWYISYNDSQNGTNPLSLNMPLVNGQTYYAVIIGPNGCPSLPFAVTVDVYLSNETFKMDELKYYPNPVSDLLTVSYTENILEIEVFDLLGKRVKVLKTDDKELKVDLSDLSSATYMIQLKTETKSQFIKIIKK